MKVCLDLHDFSITHNRIDILLKLKKHFPKFKVSLFTIPDECSSDWGPYLVRNEALKQVKRNLDWMEIIPHGLHHTGSECLAWNERYVDDHVLPTIKKQFYKDGLRFAKGFVAPHWRWTGGVVRALDKNGWWGAVDRDKVMPYTKWFYKYNFLLDEPFWESDLQVLKLHGHMYGTNNDIGRCFNNLLKLPKDTEFVFASELLEENDKENI